MTNKTNKKYEQKDRELIAHLAATIAAGPGNGKRSMAAIRTALEILGYLDGVEYDKPCRAWWDEC